MFMEEDDEVADENVDPNFKKLTIPNDSWFRKFRKRYDLSFTALHGEAGGYTKADHTQAMEELRNKLRSYNSVYSVLGTNIDVHPLPSNSTAIHQPLDQGIIRTLKAYYKSGIARSYLHTSENWDVRSTRKRIHFGSLSIFIHS